MSDTTRITDRVSEGALIGASILGAMKVVDEKKRNSVLACVQKITVNGKPLTADEIRQIAMELEKRNIPWDTANIAVIRTEIEKVVRAVLRGKKRIKTVEIPGEVERNLKLIFQADKLMNELAQSIKEGSESKVREKFKQLMEWLKNAGRWANKNKLIVALIAALLVAVGAIMKQRGHIEQLKEIQEVKRSIGLEETRKGSAEEIKDFSYYAGIMRSRSIPQDIIEKAEKIYQLMIQTGREEDIPLVFEKGNERIPPIIGYRTRNITDEDMRRYLTTLENRLGNMR